VTRQAGGARPRSSARSRDPYGIGPVSGYVAPALAVVGLVIVALVTLNLLQGQIPFLSTAKPGGGGDSGPDGGANATPAPSNVVVTPPDTVFDGSILYAKAGNIWIQTDTTPRQLTTSGQDSMPTWSADGSQIYFIRTRPGAAKFFIEGRRATRTWYDLFTPQLMQMNADGTGAKSLLTGRFSQSGATWFYWLRQPVPSPDGKTIADTAQRPLDGSSFAIRRSTLVPVRWRNATASPAGDQTGENDSPSSVTRRTSVPAESRIAMFVSNASVFVAAIQRPSGDQAGARYPGPVIARVFFDVVS
jgi:dipeptidyl aminopeptidase/acylaminoacyl peptidase